MLILKKEHIKLLKVCLEHYRKDLLWVIEDKEEININSTLGNELQEAIGDELITYGFDGDVPNKYGLLLEELIDIITTKFIK